ncbi:hypothetical protein BZG02_12805 [Labilibaculum filiforme]|uniref:ABC3 transporter permease C-terminal domain-containing protein n=1 Tax=Labilibaculum filiforme TaxID=1940526 RepID=A0A2N3HX26_9BACT|nr:hypothetical protein BZG02_12805 [Labilibaculum filiforme]
MVRIPENSHISFDYIISENYSNGYRNSKKLWTNSYWVRTYIKLAENANIEESFLSRVSNHIGRYTNKTDKLIFQPLADIHLHSDYTPGLIDKNISSSKYVWIFTGLSLLILWMVILNFSILTTAISSEQAIQIGIQKINGAKRKHLIFQFIGNSLLQTFAAAFLALLLCWLLLPWFINIIGQNLSFHLSGKLILNLIVITVITALLASIYPSFYFSKLQPISIFQKRKSSSSKMSFFSFLIIIQFAIAIFSLAISAGIIKQLNYMQSKELGINHQNMIIVPTGLWYDSSAFKNELLQNPNIISVSASSYAPVNCGWETTYALNHQGLLDSVKASVFCVDQDFANNYGLELVQGKFLQMNYDDYWEEMRKSAKNEKNLTNESVIFPIVINQTAEKLFGFSDPIGQRIDDNIIVGVVKDFHFKPLHYPIGPLVLTNSPENIMTMNINIQANNFKETILFIKKIYQKHRDQRDFSYQFFDDILNREYQQEIRLKNITSLFSALTVLIALLGIFGISWFSICQRVKEIGIRKVNGAKTYEVIAMLNKDFLKWVAIAFVIACPIAWYAMHKWLENFAYKTELSWWIFALAGIIAMGIAMLTVSFQSWRAATRNPVESLRYE